MSRRSRRVTGVLNFRQALASPHPDRQDSRSVCDHFLLLDRTMKTASRLTIVLLSAFLITGCAARGVKIAQLKDQPTKYDNKNVRVTGVVTSSWGIPLVPFQLYKVDDGTGEITVVSRYGRTPSKGTRVSVKGRINEFATFGGRSVGLHIEEQDRDYKSH
jgi:hypothetical protein